MAGDQNGQIAESPDGQSRIGQALQIPQVLLAKRIDGEPHLLGDPRVRGTPDSLPTLHWLKVSLTRVASVSKVMRLSQPLTDPGAVKQHERSGCLDSARPSGARNGPSHHEILLENVTTDCILN